MKTSHIITIAAAILAFAAPAASARPATDPAGTRPHVPQASTPAGIAAHKEQLSTQQYLASHGQAAESVPLTDRTDTDDRFPLVFVLIGLSVPLGIGLASILAKPVRAYARHRRSPASVA